MAHCVSSIPPTVLLALSEVVEVRALAMLGVRLIPEAASQGPNSRDCERAIQDEDLSVVYGLKVYSATRPGLLQ